MKTPANIKSENTIHVSKQMRLALTLAGVVVALVGLLTLVYGNNSIAGLDVTQQVKEATLLTVNVSPKIVAMNAVASLWPF